MKNFKKIMLLVLCAALLMGISVMGTLAYLKAQTGPITNTMSVGNVAITMDEAKVDVYGNPITDAARIPNGDVKGNSYKLIPGHTYTKDPTIYVTKGSEACYVFVEVANGIVGYEKAGETTIAVQMKANGWDNLSGNIWYKSVAIDARTAENNIPVPVFGSFTIADGLEDLSAANGLTITVTAYAVQADGFVDKNGNETAADEAWAATFGLTHQG